MKEKLLKNWGLKLMAVLIAFLVWFLVANIEDYTVTKTITGIPVELLNEDAITKQDMVYEIEQGKTVDIKVEGRRSIIEKLTVEDFVATADLSELSITNSVQIVVDAVSNSVRKEVNISVVDSMMKVSIEERGEEKLPIGIVTTGQTQEGYAVVSTAATPNMVTITGAASTVKDVKTVQVVVDVEGLNTSITTRGELQLLDADGEIIDSERIQTNLSTVSVTVSIQKTKEVPIRIETSGEVAEGYAVAGDIEYQPTTVLIAGDEGTIRSVGEIVIDNIDITDRNADYETTVDINSYLPEGIVVADKTQEIAIKVNIEKLVEKTLTVKPSDIRFTGKAAELGYIIAEDEEPIEVTVIGLKRDVDALSVDKINPTVDVSEMLEEGTYSATVMMQEIEGIQYKDDTWNTTVTVTKEEVTTTETTTNTSSEASTGSTAGGTTERTTEKNTERSTQTNR